LLPLLSAQYIPQASGRKSHQVPTDSLIRGRFVLLASWGESLRCTTTEPQGDLRTNLEAPLIRLVRTWVRIQACPRKQKGKLIASQRLLVTAFWGEACLSGSGSKAEVLCYAKVCMTPLRVKRCLSFSQQIVTTEVKRWITKNSVPNGGDSQENRCIIHHSTE
jgi:hypothetical protein